MAARKSRRRKTKKKTFFQQLFVSLSLNIKYVPDDPRQAQLITKDLANLTPLLAGWIWGFYESPNWVAYIALTVLMMLRHLFWIGFGWLDGLVTWLERGIGEAVERLWNYIWSSRIVARATIYCKLAEIGLSSTLYAFGR